MYRADLKRYTFKFCRANRGSSTTTPSRFTIQNDNQLDLFEENCRRQQAGTTPTELHLTNTIASSHASTRARANFPDMEPLDIVFQMLICPYRNVNSSAQHPPSPKGSTSAVNFQHHLFLQHHLRHSSGLNSVPYFSI